MFTSVTWLGMNFSTLTLWPWHSWRGSAHSKSYGPFPVPLHEGNECTSFLIIGSSISMGALQGCPPWLQSCVSIEKHIFHLWMGGTSSKSCVRRIHAKAGREWHFPHLKCVLSHQRQNVFVWSSVTHHMQPWESMPHQWTPTFQSKLLRKWQASRTFLLWTPPCIKTWCQWQRHSFGLNGTPVHCFS